MALNFSRRPIFSAHMPEDNLVSQMRFANDLNGDGFAEKWYSNRDMEGRGDSHDSAVIDILDLLPSDPFGMNISTTFATSLGVDYKLGGFNFIWNNAIRLHGLSRSTRSNKSETVGGSGAYYYEMLCKESYHGVFVSSGSMDDILCSRNDHFDSFEKKNQEMCTDRDIGVPPHEALTFVTLYLGTRDLGRVSTVCKSLHFDVHNDPLYWRHIHIDQPSNKKITDDILLELTNKAQGILQCLRLVECPWVTDNGLRRVLESNPKLTKLSVPGCTKISIAGIVDSLKAFKSNKMQGVKRLRIGGLHGLMHDHYEELKFLLGTDRSDQQSVRKPRFYIRENIYPSCDDACAIDVETCPSCQNLRLVYDCPAESCNGNECSSQPCRACILCIQRCKQCGRCFNNSEYEETFCLDYLCSVCLEDGRDKIISSFTNDANDMDVNG